MTIKNYIQGSLIGGIVVLGMILVFLLAPKAHANPSSNLFCASAAATTTVTFLTTGAATTTLTCNLQSDGGPMVDSAVLQVLQNGSTTAAQLQGYMEYSSDNVNWYGDKLFTTATTSAVLSLNTTNSFTMLSLGNNNQGSTGISSSTLRMLTVPTPVQYVRVVVSLFPGTTILSSVWLQLVAKRENR